MSRFIYIALGWVAVGELAMAWACREERHWPLWRDVPRLAAFGAIGGPIWFLVMLI